MRRRIPAGYRIDSTWPCVNCDEDEAFLVTVALGDFANCTQTTCPACGYTLTESEADALEVRAYERAPEDAIGERDDWLTHRDR